MIFVLPYGIIDAVDSSFAWSGLGAIAFLGVFATVLALVAFTTLLGRVGAPRGGITIYFLPIVAIVLGVAVRDESIEALAPLGLALVLVGAALSSRAERRRATTLPALPAESASS